MSGGAFESRKATINELLGEDQRAKVIVPAFQRAYSWDKRHVEAFWKDFTRFVDNFDKKDAPQRYFLGPIVILDKSPATIELLDGQQRIATATILFSVLRDVARELQVAKATDLAAQIHSSFISKPDENGDDIGEYALEMSELDNVYFRETVQADPPSEQKTTLRSHRNIKAARTFLLASVKQRIGTLDPANQVSQLRKLRLALQRDLVMACITVTSESEAFTIFETLNDRGLRLAVPDLLVNFLMREAASAADRTQVRQLWNQIIELTGTRDINRFLRHMWVSKYGDLKNQDLFSALKEHIEKGGLNSLDFTRTCLEECEAYVALLTVDTTALAADSVPVVSALVRTLDFQPLYPLMLSSYRVLTPDDFTKVIKWMLVYVTRQSIIGQLDPAALESVTYALAKEVRQQLKDVDPVKAADHSKASAKCASHVKGVLEGNAPNSDDTKRAAEKVDLSPAYASYVLNRIANYIQSSTKEVGMAESNLEHIYPQNPQEKEWGGAANQLLLEPYTWALGNLTIYGKKKNSKAGNKEYAVKQPGYLTSSVTMTKDLATKYKTWGVSEIEEQSRKLAKLVPLIWDFDNPSRVW